MHHLHHICLSVFWTLRTCFRNEVSIMMNTSYNIPECHVYILVGDLGETGVS